MRSVSGHDRNHSESPIEHGFLSEKSRTQGKIDSESTRAGFSNLVSGQSLVSLSNQLFINNLDRQFIRLATTFTFPLFHFTPSTNSLNFRFFLSFADYFANPDEFSSTSDHLSLSLTHTLALSLTSSLSLTIAVACSRAEFSTSLQPKKSALKFEFSR